MGPNHAEIIRVYTREPGGTIEDLTLDSATNAEVVSRSGPASGSLTDPPWDTQAASFTYTIQAVDLAGHAGNLCRVYA
jgi:hypothetical protein